VDSKQKGFDAITEQAEMGQLEFLSSDWTQEGAYMSADYFASLFKVHGLRDNESGYDDFKGIDVKGKVVCD
jgi:hypothetical protein